MDTTDDAMNATGSDLDGGKAGGEDTGDRFTIGQMMFYTTVALISLVLLYASLVVCRRRFSANKVKQMAVSLGNNRTIRNFIRKPQNIQVVDSRSDLEWDMEGLQLDTTVHQQYMGQSVQPT